MSVVKLPVFYLLDWYREIQDMHLASLILMFFALVLSISFLVAYCKLKSQLKERRRPSSALLLSKGGLALWFILPFIVGKYYLQLL